MEPFCSRWGRIDAFFVHTRKSCPQGIPRKFRLAYILNCMTFSYGVIRPVIEGAEINYIMRNSINPVKNNPEKAFLENISSPHIQFDRAGRKILAGQPYQPLET